METVYYLVLIPMVYLAAAVCAAGVMYRLFRLFRTPPHPVSLAVYSPGGAAGLKALTDTFLLPSVRRHNPVLWVFLMLFHGAFLLLILGHLELIGEISLLQVIPHEVFLGRGIVGLVLALTLLYFLFRRFVSPNRDLSVPEDYYLLILLFLTVFFGAEMHWARRWYGYGEVSVSDYREYLFSLVALRPEVPDTLTMTGHSFMLVLHIFFANVFLMVVPFSKIMHTFFAYPVNRLRRR